MAEFHILPFYHDAFLSDTSHLGALETGAYFALLCASWRTEGGGLPNDDVMLARMARCTSREWKRIRPLVMAYWTVCQDGKLRQKRLEIEREAARAKSKSASRAAKAKWLEVNKSKDADASATHMREPCGSDALISTVIVSKEEDHTPSPVAEPDDDIGNDLPEDQDARAGFVRPPSDNRSRGQRTPGDVLANLLPKTGPPEKRRKRQDKADADMARWLTTEGGMGFQAAWELLQVGRDPDHPDHTSAARQLEKISANNHLGWFAEEMA